MAPWAHRWRGEPSGHDRRSQGRRLQAKGPAPANPRASGVGDTDVSDSIAEGWPLPLHALEITREGVADTPRTGHTVTVARDRVVGRDDDVVVVERRRGSLLLKLLIALVVLAVIAVAAFFLLGNDDDEDAAKDVEVTTCEPGRGGEGPTASGTIVNSSSRASSYAIRLTFRDSDGNDVSEGVTNVNRVEPDATAKWELTGARDAAGGVTCELGDVSRTRVPGG